MTTIDTAAARRVHRAAARAGILAVFALSLAGCASTSNLLGSSAPESSPVETAATPPPAGTTAAQKGRVAIAPVIGAPDAVAKQLQGQLAGALEQRGVGVAKTPADKSDFTLRGYIVSAREKGNVKLSYIWDVTDPAGKRVNRITGEEIISGAQGKDAWAAMTPQVSQAMADKTAGSLTTWIAGAGAASVQVATASPTAPLPAALSPVGAARPGVVSAIVPGVTGAPGDGSASLKTALERELSRGGVSLASGPGPDAYKVEGVVVVGQGKDGKQPIQIDWNVKDPGGKKLGTVSQKNEIPQGSLDGAWGKTADAAAAAAAQGILKLLPQPKAVN